jgi:hypothetical protein
MELVWDSPASSTKRDGDVIYFSTFADEKYL